MRDDRAMRNTRRLGRLVASLVALSLGGCDGSSSEEEPTSLDNEPTAAVHLEDNDLEKILLGGLTARQAKCAVEQLKANNSPAEIDAAWASGKEEGLFPLLSEASRPCVRRYPEPPADNTVSSQVASCVIDKIRDGDGPLDKARTECEASLDKPPGAAPGKAPWDEPSQSVPDPDE